MERSLTTGRRPWLALGSLAIGLVVGAAVVAIAAPSTTVINACVENTTGIIKLPLKGSCPVGTTALSWNVQGPQGPRGLRGPAGPTGARGPAGTGGSVSGYEIVWESSGTMDDTYATESAICPGGKSVLGGGYQYDSPDGGNVTVHMSWPEYEDQWSVYATEDTPVFDPDWSIDVYAICAKVSY